MSIRSIIEGLEAVDEDGRQLIALHELNNLLFMGQGEIQVNAFIAPVTKILQHPHQNMEMVLLGLRAFNSIVDISPRAAEPLSRKEIVTLICTELMFKNDLDVVEQSIKFLHLLSLTHPVRVLQFGGLKSLVMFLDFLPIHVKRKALQTASTLCDHAHPRHQDSEEIANRVLEALPILTRCMDTENIELVNLVCRCFVKMVNGYSAQSPGGASVAGAQLEDSGPLPCGWNQYMLRAIGTEATIAKWVNMIHSRGVGRSISVGLVQTIAKVIFCCPSVIPAAFQNGIVEVLRGQLSPAGQSAPGPDDISSIYNADGNLSTALKLAEGVFPSCPGVAAVLASAEGSKRGGPGRTDRRIRSSSRACSAVGGAPKQAQDPCTSKPDLWECSLCTFHNPADAGACEMCSHVSPALQAHVENSQSTEKSLRDHIRSSSEEEPISLAQVYADSPELLDDFFVKICPLIMKQMFYTCESANRIRGMGILASALFHSSDEFLRSHHERRQFDSLSAVDVVMTSLAVSGAQELSAVLRLATVHLIKLPTVSHSLFVRQGFWTQLSETYSRIEGKEPAKLRSSDSLNWIRDLVQQWERTLASRCEQDGATAGGLVAFEEDSQAWCSRALLRWAQWERGQLASSQSVLRRYLTLCAKLDSVLQRVQEPSATQLSAGAEAPRRSSRQQNIAAQQCPARKKRRRWKDHSVAAPGPCKALASEGADRGTAPSPLGSKERELRRVFAEFGTLVLGEGITAHELGACGLTNLCRSSNTAIGEPSAKSSGTSTQAMVVRSLLGGFEDATSSWNNRRGGNQAGENESTSPLKLLIQKLHAIIGSCEQVYLSDSSFETDNHNFKRLRKPLKVLLQPFHANLFEDVSNICVSQVTNKGPLSQRYAQLREVVNLLSNVGPLPFLDLLLLIEPLASLSSVARHVCDRVQVALLQCQRALDHVITSSLRHRSLSFAHRGIKLGALVSRGPDWCWGHQDGESPAGGTWQSSRVVGVVVRLRKGHVLSAAVYWLATGHVHWYRWDHYGRYDLRLRHVPHKLPSVRKRDTAKALKRLSLTGSSSPWSGGLIAMRTRDLQAGATLSLDQRGLVRVSYRDGTEELVPPVSSRFQAHRPKKVSRVCSMDVFRVEAAWLCAQADAIAARRPCRNEARLQAYMAELEGVCVPSATVEARWGDQWARARVLHCCPTLASVARDTFVLVCGADARLSTRWVLLSDLAVAVPRQSPGSGSWRPRARRVHVLPGETKPAFMDSFWTAIELRQEHTTPCAPGPSRLFHQVARTEQLGEGQKVAVRFQSAIAKRFQYVFVGQVSAVVTGSEGDEGARDGVEAEERSARKRAVYSVTFPEGDTVASLGREFLDENVPNGAAPAPDSPGEVAEGSPSRALPTSSDSQSLFDVFSGAPGSGYSVGSLGHALLQFDQATGGEMPLVPPKLVREYSGLNVADEGGVVKRPSTSHLVAANVPQASSSARSATASRSAHVSGTPPFPRVALSRTSSSPAQSSHQPSPQRESASQREPGRPQPHTPSRASRAVLTSERLKRLKRTIPPHILNRVLKKLEREETTGSHSESEMDHPFYLEMGTQEESITLLQPMGESFSSTGAPPSSRVAFCYSPDHGSDEPVAAPINLDSTVYRALQISKSASTAPDESPEKSDFWERVHRLQFTLGGLESSTGHSGLVPPGSLRPGTPFPLQGRFQLSPQMRLLTTSGFPSVCPLGVLLTEGAWYFEVEVLKPGLAQVGWSGPGFAPDSDGGVGCGDDKHSWAFDGLRQRLWHAESRGWGARWKAQDVLGCYLSFSPCGRATMAFSLNGSFEAPMGVAFEAQEVPPGGLRPTVTFNGSFSGVLRLGSGALDLHHPGSVPAGLEPAQPVGQWAARTFGEVEAREASQLPRVCLSGPAEGPAGGHRDGPQTGAMQLLHLLAQCALDSEAGDVSNARAAEGWTDERLTRKLVTVLQNPLLVCSGLVPRWCTELAQSYPLLLPLEARRLFFSLTSFGVSRALHGMFETDRRLSGRGSTRPSAAPGSDSENSSESGETGLRRRNEHFFGSVNIGALKRQKAVVPRDKVLESAKVLMANFAEKRTVLAVEFSGETGHGLGPTLEFYALVCQELQLRSLGMWHDAQAAARSSQYVQVGAGLFPSVLPDFQPHVPPGPAQEHALDFFSFLGQFIAKSILDGRLLDLPLALPLCKAVMGEDLQESDLEAVDPVIFRSVEHLRSMQHRLSAPGVEEKSIDKEVEDLALDFVLPGSGGLELVKDGSNVDVTASNLGEYVDAVVDAFVGNGVSRQVSAIREGISKVFPAEALRVFTPRELQALLCGGHNEDWSRETILSNIVCKHGYSQKSPQVQQLVNVLSDFGVEERRLFLKFSTGSPRLPVTGWSGLMPRLTVVCKDVPDPDSHLPSCSTCQVYLKLPRYSSQEVLSAKLLFAIREGQGHFALD